MHSAPIRPTTFRICLPKDYFVGERVLKCNSNSQQISKPNDLHNSSTWFTCSISVSNLLILSPSSNSDRCFCTSSLWKLATFPADILDSLASRSVSPVSIWYCSSISSFSRSWENYSLENITMFVFLLSCSSWWKSWCWVRNVELHICYRELSQRQRQRRDWETLFENLFPGLWLFYDYAIFVRILNADEVCYN